MCCAAKMPTYVATVVGTYATKDRHARIHTDTVGRSIDRARLDLVKKTLWFCAPRERKTPYAGGINAGAKFTILSKARSGAR